MSRQLDILKLLMDGLDEKDRADFEVTGRQQALRKLFKNLRGPQENLKGMRLTDLGLSAMKQVFESYTITPQGNLNENPKRYTPLDIIRLDALATLPYHVDAKGIITVFDFQLAMEIQILFGDLKLLYVSNLR